MSWHQTVIVGNLGGDPELKYMQSGSAVCNFSVAVSETWKDGQSGENREKTTWYRVAVWGGQAEACNTHLQKGRQVLVIGNVSTRAYLNNNGEAAASLDLTARSVQFLGGGNGGGNGGSNAPSGESSNGGGGVPPQNNAQDIPF